MRLPPPQFDSIHLIDEIVQERQNGINAAYFNGISDQWRARVGQYIANSGSPEFVAQWPEVECRKTTFLNLYLSPGRGSSQGAMLKALRSHELTLCPSCGEAGAPNTLDHYLPKSLYPHFCVTPLNLFPMCDACQGNKLEKTGDARNPRLFLHPYFDVFVAQRVLELGIHPPFDKPTFTLSVCATLTPVQAALVGNHMRELAIEDRYAHFFRDQHRRLLRLVHRMRLSGQGVSANLQAFKMSCADPSQNSWEHIFYSAVLSNPALLQYLESERLPDFL